MKDSDNVILEEYINTILKEIHRDIVAHIDVIDDTIALHFFGTG